MRKLSTARDVITALGGLTKVARLVNGWTPHRVYNWREQGYFPPHTHTVFKAALAEIDRDAPDSLWRMAKPNAKALEALRQGIG